MGLLASGNSGTIGADLGNIDVTGWNVSAFGLLELTDDLYLTLMGGGGIISYDTSRRQLTSTDDVTGSVDGTIYGGAVGIGYEIDIMQR